MTAAARLGLASVAVSAALALRSQRVRDWLGDLLISTGCHLLGPEPPADPAADAARLERIAAAIHQDAIARNNGRSRGKPSA